MFKKIQQDYIYEFNVNEAGLYTVEIEASCKPGKLFGLFKGEDLMVEIDRQKFREIPAIKRAQYFNIPPSWNGTKLKGRLKRVFFVLHLEKGTHKINFIPKRGAIIQKEPAIRLYNHQYNVIENMKAQDGDRRPWITVALIDLPLKMLDVSVTCEKRKRDSDDLKLIINGKTEKNKQSNWWGRNWYWQGRQLKGNIKNVIFYPNLKKDIHYIEFWADRMPVLNKVKLDLGIKNNLPQDKPTKDISLNIPTVERPKWTEDFNDDTEQMLLARAIFGEARQIEFSDKLRIAVGWSIKNRISSSQWGDSYHEIILEKAQYSAFNKGDNNLPYVKDPLHKNNDTNKKAWENCYEIAGKVIRGEVSDPTDGANHYFSDFIDPPKWTKSPQAEFKIKIDNTLFYEVDWRRSGFIKILLITLLTAILLLSGLYFTSLVNSKNETASVILEPESFKHLFIHPKTKEIFKISFNEKGEFLRLQQITDDGYLKSSLKIFSDSDRFGYFQDLHTAEEVRNLNSNDSEATKEYYENHIALMIMKNEYSEPYEVYRGDYHTSYWELVGYDNKHAIIYYNCGSSCLYAYEINSLTGEIKSEYFEHTPMDFVK